MEITTITTQGANTLLAGVRSALDGADSALLCVAFVQAAGVHLLRRQIEGLASSTRLLLTTVFSQSSSALSMAQGLGTSVSTLNPGSGTFHPKVYLARRGLDSVAVIGSANLTGGLVSNVEAAVMLRGTIADEPILAAWQFAEALWSDPRRRPWTSAGALVEEETFDPALYALLQAVIDANHGLFATLDKGRPNRVTAATHTGLYVETDASKAKGNKPQLIPAWMFTLAWEYLRAHGRLTNRYLLAQDGLNVKRSSAVCAILARLPGVVATVSADNGITLTWSGGDPG